MGRGLEPTASGARVVWEPTQTTLAEIVEYAERESVLAVAVDAQLTLAVSDLTGFRSGDLALRGMLPVDCYNWVQSINSMMAVATDRHGRGPFYVVAPPGITADCRR